MGLNSNMLWCSLCPASRRRLYSVMDVVSAPACLQPASSFVPCWPADPVHNMDQSGRRLYSLRRTFTRLWESSYGVESTGGSWGDTLGIEFGLKGQFLEERDA